MATGGSGDVLSGILGGLLATARRDPALLPANPSAKVSAGFNLGAGAAGQVQPSYGIGSVAALGVYLHGLAGDAAAKKLGEAPVMASDIADGIADVLKNV